MQEPEVIAVILNYKRSKDTIECVKALQHSVYSPLRILVVNNAPADTTTDEIQSTFPTLEIISTGHNYGYAGGMNFGIRRALQLKSEYLFLANSDTVVEPDAISILVKALASRPTIAAATGTICYYENPKRIWCADGKINFWRASAFCRTELPQKRRIREGGIVPVTFISGCAFLVRSSAIEDAGMFDERFFMYLEDSELCSRFLRKGFDLIYVPKVMIRHKAHKDTIEPFPLYYSIRNRFLFLKLAAPPFARFAGFIYLSLVVAIKITFWSVARRDLSKSAILAIRDYRDEAFVEGHGLVLHEMLKLKRT
ncbi:MAG: glycosyltransferase family 2 protein [Bacteroidota bacterium]